MKYKNLLVLLLISLHVPFLHVAQESQIQDEPFVIVPFDQFLDQTVTNYPKIDEIFTFLHEQGCINTSFRQFLQRELANDEDENDQRDASFDVVLELAHEIIATNMKGRFIDTLDAAMNNNKSFDQFHDPIFLYVMQHKNGCMHYMVNDWLHEWSKIKYNNDQVPLHRAVINNHIEVVQLLIAAGAYINHKDREDKAPLHIAAFKNRPEIARLLIAAGAYTNHKDREGKTPLHLASPEVARLLIDAGADINIEEGYFSDTPLHRAIIDHRPEAVCLLIGSGANLNLQNRRGQTPLHLAVIYDYIEIARLLIAKGANINLQDNYDDTPLHLAAFKNRPEIARLLIDAGSDLNLQNDTGRTPLCLAVIDNHTEIARLLIGACTDVNIQDNDGRTPLYWAACYDRPEIAHLLINARGDLNLQNDTGRTPLHEAAFKNRPEIACLLIDAGVDVNIQDNDGRIAEQIAHTPEMRALFVQVPQDKKDARDMAILDNQIKKYWR